MKKLFLTTVLCSWVFSSFAQPSSGLAPDFMLRDLNGNWHSLYTYLDQGKTVFLKFSATWCQPCWNFHNSNVFKDLYQQHGPAGQPGVNGNTTNDVMVFFIEGEPDNTVQQLYGISGAGSAQATMGNWVTGTLYPIIDTNAATTTALLNTWNISSFPTILMICRDRQVYKYPQQPASQFYSAAQFGCPQYPPASTVDAKAVQYNDNSYFFCMPDPIVRFQNYSTNNLTSATIRIFSNSTLLNTHNWSGSLAPYQIANVNIPAFTAAPYSGYRFEVDAPGDVQTTNNRSSDSLFWVYSPGNAAALPMQQNFNTSPLMPHKFRSSRYDVDPVNSSYNTAPVIYVKGIDGQNTRAIRFRNRLMWWYQQADLIIGNYNTQSSANLTLEFDVAFAQYNGNENDTMEVLASTDCGGSWHTVWLKSGADLATRSPVGNFTDFYPQQSSHWRHETADLSAYKDANTLIMFRTHCHMGNDMWIDNLKLHFTTSVDDVFSEPNINLVPNPASDQTFLTVNMRGNAKATMTLRALDGRKVQQMDNINLSAGSNNIMVPLSGLSAGLYFVSLTSGNFMRTAKLVVDH